MKPVIFFIALFNILSDCYAQKPDTVYYDADWNKADWMGATYYRIVYPKENEHYKVEDRFIRNDKLQMTGSYLSIDTEFTKSEFIFEIVEGDTSKTKNIKDGIFTYYDNKGNISSIGSYNHNQRIGTWANYYDSTNIIWNTIKYDSATADDTLISYYKDGKIKRIEEDLHDTAKGGICYNEDGTERRFTPFLILPKPAVNINQFLNANLHYPKEARENNIQGKVLLSFTVNEDGSISKVNATGNKILYREAARVLFAMPPWHSGAIDDKNVKIFFTLPVNFRLE